MATPVAADGLYLELADLRDALTDLGVALWDAGDEDESLRIHDLANRLDGAARPFYREWFADDPRIVCPPSDLPLSASRPKRP
jgi:hypothetical protein